MNDIHQSSVVESEERAAAVNYIEFLQHMARGGRQKRAVNPETYIDLLKEAESNEFGKIMQKMHGDAGKNLINKVLVDGVPDNGVTPEDDPMLMNIILHLQKQIEDICNEKKVDLSGKFLFSTIQSNEINAICAKVPDSAYGVILVDGQLVTFCNLISKVFAETLPLKPSRNGMQAFSFDRDEIKRRLKKKKNPINRLFDVLGASIIAGRASFAEPWGLEPEHVPLHALLLNAMEIFAIGHEYGHIICKHTNNAAHVKSKIGDEIEIDEIIFNWSQEIEADVVGFQLMMAVQSEKGFDAALSAMGAYVFLKAMELHENISAKLTGLDPFSSLTHPPAKVRVQKLSEFVQKFLPKEDCKSVERLFRKVNMIFFIYERYMSDMFQPIQEDAMKIIKERKETIRHGSSPEGFSLNDLSSITSFSENLKMLIGSR
ncbi:hypothetical protein [Azospirillum sp. sgz302134]